ncbi:hypothetical protein SCHPADRAFT_27852 [Schizopora paradoxa]|uniref:LysM domain-containing protein n=1 Tax=Schizopora paradoxa TaxID=27342 RepID=A0A0H2SEB2_9AGAM|nr:hypothetical protein SCHPADRAFT_27852 [Schizopora paradoxa]
MPVKSNKWSQYDEPEYRTGGMKRVGYDADTQQYTYRDTNGSLWESSPGVEYGRLSKVSSGHKEVGHRDQSDTTSSSVLPPDGKRDRKKTSEFRYTDDNTLTIVTTDKKTGNEEVANVFAEPDLEATQAESPRVFTTEDKVSDYPTSKETYRALLPFFLVVCAFLLLIIRLFHPALVRPSPPPCPQHSRSYEIKSGDTCWAVAKDYSTTVDSLRSFNPTLECSTLQPGQHICVPVKD